LEIFYSGKLYFPGKVSVHVPDFFMTTTVGPSGLSRQPRRKKATKKSSGKWRRLVGDERELGNKEAFPQGDLQGTIDL